MFTDTFNDLLLVSGELEQLHLSLLNVIFKTLVFLRLAERAGRDENGFELIGLGALTYMRYFSLFFNWRYFIL